MHVCIFERNGAVAGFEWAICRETARKCAVKQLKNDFEDTEKRHKMACVGQTNTACVSFGILLRRSRLILHLLVHRLFVSDCAKRRGNTVEFREQETALF